MIVSETCVSSFFVVVSIIDCLLTRISFRYIQFTKFALNPWDYQRSKPSRPEPLSKAKGQDKRYSIEHEIKEGIVKTNCSRLIRSDKRSIC